MSKFFYSGSLEQVNYLSRRDLFLESIYGNYHLIFIEGFLSIFCSIGAFLILFFFPELLKTYPYLIQAINASFFFLMALSFLIEFYKTKKRGKQNFLRPRAILDIFLGIFMFLIPDFFFSTLYGSIGLILIFRGFANFRNKRFERKGSFIIALFEVILGGAFLYLPYSGYWYKEIAYFILMIVFGIYLIWLGINFRRSFKKYLDEELGFTEYTIE